MARRAKRHEKRNSVRRYRSSTEWYRQQTEVFPEYAAMMPDPSRPPLYLSSNRSVAHAFRCATQKLQGGRAHG
jgi:hypothetical protein